MPSLTELKIRFVRIDETDAIELLNSNFMSTIKKLELSYSTDKFSTNFYEFFSESKYLNQIAHLAICNNRNSQIGRVDLLLKDKIYLEHLQICNYQLSLYPNLLTNGNYKNLKYLNISCCQIKNQEFVNLFISPNLPILESIIANSLINEIDQTVAVFPPNSQSSVTELNFISCNPGLFPSLIDHCPKLKRLAIHPLKQHIENEKSKKIFENMMKSPGLSNLEFLETSRVGKVEEIFINPIYSNLKDLYIADTSIGESIDNVKFISNCTNLKNITSMDLSGVYVNERSLIEEFSNALKNNPTFSKLKHIELPEAYDTDDEDDDIESD